jgi:phosphoribosylformimino-5-aminoimidazole carboxamide ribotide isomerase
MDILPAIDLKGGRCVRLTQGAFDRVETYSEDPVKYALRWQREGATRLHLVDLDGARVGMPQAANVDVVRQIVRRISIPVELGGGIRSAEIVEQMLRIGVERVVLGTTLAQNTPMAESILLQYGERIVVGIDAKNGRVAVSGWLEQTDESATAFARRMVQLGARRIIFTDVARDGTLAGPNVDALCEILAAVDIPVIASGGIGSLDHVEAVASIAAPNLEGLIVGKALYAGAVRLPEAIAATRRESRA